MKDGTKIMSAISFSENVIAIITMKPAWMIHTYFAAMRIFFNKVSITFNTLLPMLSKMLYSRIVKLPVSTLEHILKTLFQFLTICKMVSTECILYSAKHVVVVPSIPFLLLPHLCTSWGVRPGTIMKEKDVFHASVWMNCMDALLQLV
jgi:hypothetical protein